MTITLSNVNDMVPRRHRVAYGFAELGSTGAEILLRISLLIFYTDVVGLSASYAGLAIGLAVIWDAVSDPIMGKITDNVAIANKRRLPYMFIGALVLALGVVLIFRVPELSSQLGKFAYLLFFYILVNTGMTLVSVPHLAFAGDYPLKGKDRVELFGWRTLFANLGLVLGTAIPGVLAVSMSDVSQAGVVDTYTAMLMAFIIVIAVGVTFYSSRAYDHFEVSARANWELRQIFAELLQVVQNKNFTFLLIAYFIANLGLSLNSALALYYYRYRLELSEEGVRFILLVFLAVFSLSIPLWIKLSDRFSKTSLIMFGVISLGILTSIVYPLFPKGQVFPPLIMAIVGGVLVGSVVLLEAKVADIAEGDSIIGVRKQYGSFFGIWKMMSKISRAFALVVLGQLLTLIGFQANAVQDPTVSFYLALLFGPVVGGFLIMSAIGIKFIKD